MVGASARMEMVVSFSLEQCAMSEQWEAKELRVEEKRRKGSSLSSPSGGTDVRDPSVSVGVRVPKSNVGEGGCEPVSESAGASVATASGVRHATPGPEAGRAVEVAVGLSELRSFRDWLGGV